LNHPGEEGGCYIVVFSPFVSLYSTKVNMSIEPDSACWSLVPRSFSNKKEVGCPQRPLDDIEVPNINPSVKPAESFQFYPLRNKKVSSSYP
jgi:hypothetical protein